MNKTTLLVKNDNSCVGRILYFQGNKIYKIYEGSIMLTQKTRMSGNVVVGTPQGYGRFITYNYVQYSFWNDQLPNGKYVTFKDNKVNLQGQFTTQIKGKIINLVQINDKEIKNMMRNCKIQPNEQGIVIKYK